VKKSKLYYKTSNDNAKDILKNGQTELRDTFYLNYSRTPVPTKKAVRKEKSYEATLHTCVATCIIIISNCPRKETLLCAHL